MATRWRRPLELISRLKQTSEYWTPKKEKSKFFFTKRKYFPIVRVYAVSWRSVIPLQHSQCLLGEIQCFQVCSLECGSRMGLKLVIEIIIYLFVVFCVD